MRVLVVGAGAREHAIVKAVKRSEEDESIELIAWMPFRNPGINQEADKTIIRPLHDLTVLEKLSEIDIAFIGPEFPLTLGLTNTLETMGIPVVAPRKMPAQLELSKVFARDFLSKQNIPGNPGYHVCYSDVDIYQAFREFPQPCIKPDGLTGGKGVRIYGEHFKNEEEGIDYAQSLLKKDKKLVIEEKLEGREFTLQVITDGTRMVPFPLVRDFKRAFDGDQGPNTGSMGSYSCPNHKLPDIASKHLFTAEMILIKTIEGIRKVTGHPYIGILYGQFMVSNGVVYLIEFNVRFGDPEAINVLSILKSNWIEVGFSACQGNLKKLEFEKKATVCIYLTPSGYPVSPKVDMQITIPTGLRADVYYASVIERDWRIYTTKSRSIALLSTGDSVEEARQIALKDAQKFSSDLHYRTDIAIIDNTRD